jgi:RimJ/RimL family protein N-acetyltransferase
VIETARLVLRPLGVGDIPAMIAGAGDLAVSRMLARVPYPYTEEHARTAVAAARAGAVTARGVVFAVTLNGKMIGQVGLHGIPARYGTGYWLARPYWGHGYATEAVAAVVAYAFDVLGARMVRAGVFVDNPASLHLLGKLGFRRVGVRNSRSLARNERLEHIATVLTRARYRSLKREVSG